MDLIKKTFDRAKQSVVENFGDAEYTEYEPEFRAQLNRTDDIRDQVEKLLGAFECFIQPDPAIRILAGFTQEETNKGEIIALQMSQLSKVMGEWSGKPNFNLQSVKDLMKHGEDSFAKIGKFEREYLSASTDAFMVPMKRFLSHDMKTLDKERQDLKKLRLDMDSIKNKLKNKDDAAYPQLTAERDKAVSVFEIQKVKVGELMMTVESQVPNLLQMLKKYVTINIDYMKKSQKTLEELNKKI